MKTEEQLRPPEEDCSTLIAVTVTVTGTYLTLHPNLPPSHYCPFLLGQRTNPGPVKVILKTVARPL